MLEIIAERLVGTAEVQPIHESSRCIEYWLAAEILPASVTVRILGSDCHERFHRIGVPRVHQEGLRWLVVPESTLTGVEFFHADIGRVADLAVAIHRRLHGGGGRR